VIAVAHGPVCVAGVHACDAEHVAHWLAPELWVIELAGEISASAEKLVASRGRLVRRVEGWDREKARAFAAACIGRARDITCEVLRRTGEGSFADQLAACPDAESIGALAAAWGAAAAPQNLGSTLGGSARASRAAPPNPPAALAMGYLADAVLYAPIDPSASMFCSAHTGLTEEGFARERAWQSRWLAEDLALATLLAT
jgi:hypothetical protein